MSLRFSCTSCGRCCHDLRLPLSLREALDWTRRGGVVEILTDAAPDLSVEGADPAIAYRRERSIPAVSGSLPIRVNLMLVARFAGPCPHLLPSMRCGAYEVRPNTCRIYPAEVLPGRLVSPMDKCCPPDAWSEEQPTMAEAGGRPTDPTVAEAISRARASGLADVAGKSQLALLLGIRVTALANEGLMVHHRPRSVFEVALEEVCSVRGAATSTAWSFASRQDATIALVEEAGAEIANSSDWDPAAHIEF